MEKTKKKRFCYKKTCVCGIERLYLLSTSKYRAPRKGDGWKSITKFMWKGL